MEKWRQHLGWTDRRFYFGFGFGSDMNGFGAQGDPRGAGATDPVTYPFTGLGGVRVDRQRSGERVYDVNSDGVAHYGLYADWVEDAEHVAGADGPALGADLARGAEAYLQTWERAWGLAPDSCRNPGLRTSVKRFTRAADTGHRCPRPHATGRSAVAAARPRAHLLREGAGQEAGADDRRAVPRRQGDGRTPRLSSQRRLHDGLR